MYTQTINYMKYSTYNCLRFFPFNNNLNTIMIAL